MPGSQTRTFPVPNSNCRIPATARSYPMNVTVVPQGPFGYLTIYPTGLPQPFVSTLNSPRGTIVANAAIVPAGANGGGNVFVTDKTDVVLDINGHFAPPGTAGAPSFSTVTPCRVLDTRNADGPFGGPVMAGGSSRTLPLASSGCGIPSGAKAYSLNITVVPQEPLGYLTVWPAGSPQPLVSTLNSFEGKVVANAAVVPADATGSISLFVTNRTHVIVDINGYFAPAQ